MIMAEAVPPKGRRGTWAMVGGGIVTETKRFLTWILRHRDSEPLVISVAVITIVWGLSIAPSNVFDQNPSYRIFQSICEEWVLGSFLVALGITKLWALVYSRHRTLRWLMLLSAATWEALAGGVAASWIDSAAPPLYATIGLISLWAYLMLGVDGSHD